MFNQPPSKCNCQLVDASSVATSWACDSCKNSHVAGSKKRYRCSQHDFDLCIDCAVKQNRCPPTQFNVPPQQSVSARCNKCPNVLSEESQRPGFWRCDKCNNNFSQGQVVRLRCNQHDFDICGPCGASQQQQQQPNLSAGISCQQCHQQMVDATQQPGHWRCDKCSKNYQQGQKRSRCHQHDSDICGECEKVMLQSKNYPTFNDAQQQQNQFNAPPQQNQFNAPPTHNVCHTCRNPLTDATQRESNWRCNTCGNNFKFHQKMQRNRCDQHDFDVCGSCVQNNAPQPDLSGFNQPPPPQQQNLQGFNQPPQQFNQPPQQFNQAPQQFNQPPPQQQQGFNQPPPQQQQGFNQPPQQFSQPQQFNPPAYVDCYHCNVMLQPSTKQNNWRCDVCSSVSNTQRLRCEQHDYDVCQPCSQKILANKQQSLMYRIYCKKCKGICQEHMQRNSNWRCDSCHTNSFGKSDIRYRCIKDDYDVCFNCAPKLNNILY